MCDIFTLGLNANHDPITNHFLYQTSLVRRILSTSATALTTTESTGYLATSSSRIPKGFLIFMRRIASKMVEAAKSNEEIASFMESIPEWGDYAQGELRQANEIMNKPLGQDSTKMKKSHF